jgi:SAM-dependent methyltransferase
MVDSHQQHQNENRTLSDLRQAIVSADLPAQARELALLLASPRGDSVWTVESAAKELHLPESTVRAWLLDLKKANLFETIAAREGKDIIVPRRFTRPAPEDRTQIAIPSDTRSTSRFGLQKLIEALQGLGPRRILEIPAIYTFFQKLVRGDGDALFVSRYVKPCPGARVLDIGCGPARILEHMPDVHYVGFDLHEPSIAAAKRRFGTRAELFCASVSKATLEKWPPFDTVIATGVLHHLTDREVLDLLNFAAHALAEGGSVITWDCCYVEGQSALSRFLIDRDRGEHVRNVEGYVRLARKVFREVGTSIDYDLVRIPSYPCIVMRLSQPC